MVRPASFQYTRARDLGGAVAALERNGTPLAGGQALLQVMKLRQQRPSHIVDIKKVDGLAGVEIGPDGAGRIGALTRLVDLAASKEVAQLWPWLREAARLVGDVQVRNRATAAGNLCFADPRGNLAPPLLAMGARIVIQSSSGDRTVDLAELFRGFRQNSLTTGELLTHIEVPAWPRGSKGSYLELSRQPQGLAMVNVATVTAGDPVKRVGIAAGGIHQTPIRLTRLEEALSGHPLEGDRVDAALDQLDVSDVQPVEDLHATGPYRLRVLKTLVKRSLLDGAS